MCIRDRNDVERRQLIEALISEIQIYPERQPNGQWLKSIKFRLPIIEEDMNISLDNEEQVKTVVIRSATDRTFGFFSLYCTGEEKVRYH